MRRSRSSWICWERRWPWKVGNTSEEDWTSRVRTLFLSLHCIVIITGFFPSRLTGVVVGFDNYGGLTLINQSLRLGNGSVSPG